ncbi:MAG: hypothetical protein Q4G18_12715, partial [Myroides sp.]|nr:hypothetical protein [Myroides sp.]
MRILLFFLYVAFLILCAYLDGKLFFGIQLGFTIIFVIYILFYRKKSIKKEPVTMTLVSIIVLFSASSALFLALLNHKTEFIGRYSTFYNLGLKSIFIVCLLYPTL